MRLPDGQAADIRWDVLLNVRGGAADAAGCTKRVVFALLRGRIPWRQENCIPKSTRVQARGARALSFVCCAPNDGFSPESASPSGLVQRKLCSTLCAYSAWNTQVGRSWPLACPIRGLPFNRPTDWRGMAPFRAPFYNDAKRPPQPSASRAVKPKNPPAAGRSILRTLSAEGAVKAAPPQPSARRAVKPKNPPAPRPVNLKNLPTQPFYTTLPRQRQPLRRSCHLFFIPEIPFPPKGLCYQRELMELRRDIPFLLPGPFLIRDGRKGKNFS